MAKYFSYAIAALVLVTLVYFAIDLAGLQTPSAFVLYQYELREIGEAKVATLPSVLVAYFFVAFFSLLFFGLGAPVAMALEAMKYASLYTAQGMHAFDFAFAAPGLIAAYAASLLSEGLLEDYEHRGIVFKNWEASLILFLMGLALVIALYFLRGTLVGSGVSL